MWNDFVQIKVFSRQIPAKFQGKKIRNLLNFKIGAEKTLILDRILTTWAELWNDFYFLKVFSSLYFSKFQGGEENLSLFYEITGKIWNFECFFGQKETNFWRFLNMFNRAEKHENFFLDSSLKYSLCFDVGNCQFGPKIWRFLRSKLTAKLNFDSCSDSFQFRLSHFRLVD